MANDKKAAASRKGNKHGANSRRRDRKKASHLRNLRDRMNTKSPSFRSEADADKATRLYLGNKNH